MLGNPLHFDGVGGQAQIPMRQRYILEGTMVLDGIEENVL